MRRLGNGFWEMVLERWLMVFGRWLRVFGEWFFGASFLPLEIGFECWMLDIHVS